MIFNSDTIPHVVRLWALVYSVEGGVKPWQSVIFVISQFTSEIRWAILIEDQTESGIQTLRELRLRSTEHQRLSMYVHHASDQARLRERRTLSLLINCCYTVIHSIKEPRTVCLLVSINLSAVLLCMRSISFNTWNNASPKETARHEVSTFWMYWSWLWITLIIYLTLFATTTYLPSSVWYEQVESVISLSQ